MVVVATLASLPGWVDGQESGSRNQAQPLASEPALICARERAAFSLPLEEAYPCTLCC